MPTINDKFYREIRCAACRKLLGYEFIFAGRVALFCSRCGELNELKLTHMRTKENAATIETEFSVGSSTTETKTS